ncbi:fungal-specific transcription factor domain-containing protein [Aspergillus spinulosporus]
MSALVNKACDRCRAKKIRCTSPTEAGCAFCQPYLVENRNERSPELYIDYLLERGPARHSYPRSSNQDQASPSPNISFFPAKRVHDISRELGHNRLEHLLEAIRAVIAARLKSASPLVTSGVAGDTGLGAENMHRLVKGPAVEEYISTYMELVHPFFPFLCSKGFQERAAAPSLIQDLAASKSWACLYYAVVAVGCQYCDGGSYEARGGTSWAYFEQAMSYSKDLHYPRISLTSVQAIFCQSISGFGLESSMLAEAAVMAQSLGLNRSTSASESASARTFWVLYYMEKTSCFVAGRVPTLQDSHISCPLPDTSEWSFSDYDWLISFVKYSRLTSKIQSRLFTITSTPQSWRACRIAVKALQDELEKWRNSIPRRFRPGEPLRPRMLAETRALSIALRTHYYYRYAYLTLIWTLLHCGSEGKQTETALGNEELDLKTELMQTARGVLELTSYIEISPSTPIWILALTPLSALMILFDLVIHNPNHPDTTLNLALLDVASGHFSRIEYSSKGVLPGSLISEFAHLAREYISDIRCNTSGRLKIGHYRRKIGAGRFQEGESSRAQKDKTFPPSTSPSGAILPSPPLSSFANINTDEAVDPVTVGEMVAMPTAQDQDQGQDQDSFFAPDVAQVEQLQYLGVDLMGLFDPSYSFLGGDELLRGN